jgi:hypothetical protein
MIIEMGEFELVGWPTAAADGPIVLSYGYRWLWSNGAIVISRPKLNFVSVTVPTKNSTWNFLGLNFGLLDRDPATKALQGGNFS